MLRLKQTAAIAGFLLAIAGIALGDRRIVWTAIACLVLAFLLRVAERRRGATPDDTRASDE